MENIFDSNPYRPVKWAMHIMGQWPFQSAGRNKFFKCLTIFIVTSICLPTMIKFAECLDDIDIVMESVPMFCVYGAAYIKFFTWAIDDNKMRGLLLAVDRDWRNLKIERDVKILTEFSERGKNIGSFYAISIYGLLSLFLGMPAIPILMDKWIPLNESRSRIFLYQTEYFVDQNEYYFPILIHAYLTIPIVFTCIIWFDNLLSMLVNHTCGMCSILKSHLEGVHIEDLSDNVNTSSQKQLELCSDMQTDILEFVQRLESIYTIPFLILVGMNMVVITSTGMMIVMKGNEVSQVIRFASFNIGTIFHLFWGSWLGHALIVESETIYLSVSKAGFQSMVSCDSPRKWSAIYMYIPFFDVKKGVAKPILSHYPFYSLKLLMQYIQLINKAERLFIHLLTSYQSEWYSLAPKLQRMLLPLMMRSATPCQITAGKFYVMSMESFGAAMRMTMSFFTLLLSMR